MNEYSLTLTKKEKIIEKAIELFASLGYEATSIQRLAEESGVAQGLLYRHFKNKEDLLLHLIKTGMEQIGETLTPYHDEHLSFDQAFEKHISLCCAYIIKHPKLWKVLHTARLHMQAPGQLPDLEQAVIQPIAHKLKTSGYKNTKTTAWAIVALVDGITAMYLLHPSQFPLTEIKNILINQVKNYAN